MTIKRICLCLAHICETGLDQKNIKEAFDTKWGMEWFLVNGSRIVVYGSR